MKKLLLLFLLAFLAVPIASAEESVHIDHNPRRGSKHQAVYLG